MHPQLIEETTLELDPLMPAWDHPEMCAIVSIFATTTTTNNNNKQHQQHSFFIYSVVEKANRCIGCHQQWMTYNQLYMLPDGQCFYVTEPAFSLMLGCSDIFSVSSYSLAIMKKKTNMKQQFSSN